MDRRTGTAGVELIAAAALCVHYIISDSRHISRAVCGDYVVSKATMSRPGKEPKSDRPSGTKTSLGRQEGARTQIPQIGQPMRSEEAAKKGQGEAVRGLSSGSGDSRLSYRGKISSILRLAWLLSCLELSLQLYDLCVALCTGYVVVASSM